MYILTDEFDNILGIGVDGGRGVFPEADPTRELYRIGSQDTGYLYFVTDGYSLWSVNDSDIPEGLNDETRGQYLYNPSNGFYQNTNWVPAQPTQEEINAQNAAALSYLAIMTGVDLSDV